MIWLKAQDYRQMPWKNGGGLTREIAASGTAASGTYDGILQWRLSIATIAQSGPFSLFRGIDRTIALLDGDALRLDISGKKSILLDTSARPFSFRGEWNVEAHIEGAATTDLNIMTCRDKYYHQMIRYVIINPVTIKNRSDCGFVVFNNDCHILQQNKIFSIKKYDTISMNKNEKIKINTNSNRVIFYTVFINRKS